VLPEMALIETAYANGKLHLSRPRMNAIEISLSEENAPTRPVEVWGDSALLAEDCGADAHRWLTEVLGRDAWLVRMGPAFHRPVRSNRASSEDRVTFADGFPLLIVSEASLEHLNARLIQNGEKPVPMNRFRPNIVIRNTEPHAEDSWTRVKIGEHLFRTGGPCARCIVTTTDQITGKRGIEPLRTLAKYRRDARDPQNVNFAQNLINESKAGTIKMGDGVLVL
jgi:uncharacterized protein YcbX